MSEDSREMGVAVFLGLGIPFLLYWCCCGGIFAYVLRYLKREAKEEFSDVVEDTMRIPKGSFHNYWPIISTVFDACQFTSFSYHIGPVPWPSSVKLGLNELFKFFFFHYDSLNVLQSLTFWITMIFVIVYAVILLLLLIASIFNVKWINSLKDRAIDIQEGPIRSIGIFFLFEFPPIFYLPMAWTMLAWLSCNYQFDPPVLDMNSNLVCWEGSHAFYAALSIFSLVLFFPVTLLVNSAKTVVKTDVKMKPSFLILVSLMKFLVACICSFFTDYQGVYIASVMMLCLVLLTANIIQKPCNVYSVNFLRSISLGLGLWSSICAAIAAGIDNAIHEDSYTAFVLLLVGYFLILSISLVYLFRKIGILCFKRNVNYSDFEVPQPYRNSSSGTEKLQLVDKMEDVGSGQEYSRLDDHDNAAAAGIAEGRADSVFQITAAGMIDKRAVMLPDVRDTGGVKRVSLNTNVPEKNREQRKGLRPGTAIYSTRQMHGDSLSSDDGVY